MWKRDTYFGKVLEEDGPWIAEAKEAKEEIMKFYQETKPMRTIPTGYSKLWKLHTDTEILTRSLPKFAKWLDDNDAFMQYWTVNEVAHTTVGHWTDEMIDALNIPPILKDKEFTIGVETHSDMDTTISKMENLKNNFTAKTRGRTAEDFKDSWVDSEEEARTLGHFPSLSINIPMDDGKGLDEIEVFKWGNPAIEQVSFKDLFDRLKEEGKFYAEEVHYKSMKHGFFKTEELQRGFFTTDAGKKVVMLNITQPHRWTKTTDDPNARLLIRVLRKGDEHKDAFNLFDANVPA
jgi:hypothetical protein